MEQIQTDEPDDAELMNVTECALDQTVQRVRRPAQQDRVAMALPYLLTRVTNTWHSIRVLSDALMDRCPKRFMVDAGTLVRAMYDAYLQAAFIVHDPEKQQERAALYLDYQHVEKFLLIKKFLKHPTVLSAALLNSARRPDGERYVTDQYERVNSCYWNETWQKPRNKWYEGSLWNLAQAVGAEADYDYFVSAFNGCVHSSAFAVKTGASLNAKHVMMVVSVIACSTAKLALKHIGAELASRDQGVIDGFGERPFLEQPGDATQ